MLFGLGKPAAAEVVSELVRAMEMLRASKSFKLRVSQEGNGKRRASLEVAPHLAFDSDFPLRYRLDTSTEFWVRYWSDPQRQAEEDEGPPFVWPAALTFELVPNIVDDVMRFHEVLLKEMLEKTKIDAEFSWAEAHTARFQAWAFCWSDVLEFFQGNAGEEWKQVSEAQMPYHADAFWRMNEDGLRANLSGQAMDNFEWIATKLEQLGFPEGYEIDLWGGLRGS
jgi:hypothetical protein